MFTCSAQRLLIYVVVFYVVLTCTPERGQLLPELPELTAASVVTHVSRVEWQQVTAAADCAAYRDALSAIYLQHDFARRHVLGAWLLCAVNKKDMRAARMVAERLLEQTALLDEWRAVALWVYWLDEPSPQFPGYLPSVGAHVLTPAAVAAVADKLDLATELFAAFPDWRAWSQANVERLVAQLPANVRIAVAKKLRARGRLPEAWSVLSPLWSTETMVVGATLKSWWPNVTSDDMLWFAELAFDLRRYADAAAAAEAAFKSDRRQGTALFVWGRSLARSGRASQAEQIWQSQRQHIAGSPAWARVTYRLGLLAEDRADFVKAAEYYSAAAAAIPRHADSDEAGFRAGWLAKLAGNNKRASDIWRQELARRPEPAAEHRLLYWLTQVNSDDPQWRQKLQERAPFSFYNWLLHGQQWQALTTLVQWQEGPMVPLELLKKVQFLYRLGFVPPARLELLQILSDLHDNDSRLLALLTAQDLDLADEALRQFWRYFEGEFQPDAAVQRRDYWRVVYPRPYLSIVTREAKARDLLPSLVYAIMREESTFAASVISPAGAVGLLQLMPSTAQMVAQQHHLPYDGPASLEKPEINIPIATAYLQSLLQRYRGDLIYAVAAYNAGEGAVDRWLAKGPMSPDVFVEEIPYSETRRYVVKVLRSFVRYQVVYQNMWNSNEVGH